MKTETRSKLIWLSRAAIRAIVTGPTGDEDGNTVAWPTGDAIVPWRALVARGLATETDGVCEGCDSEDHKAGNQVPVFTAPRSVGDRICMFSQPHSDRAWAIGSEVHA